MLLTSKLLSFLNGVFDKSPQQFLALRLRYSTGLMVWRVENAVLTTTVTGGPGSNLSVDLSAYTLTGLVNYLASRPGYTVEYADASELSGLSARVLVDASGNIGESNGDHLYGYTNVLWAWLEAAGKELTSARLQIAEMLKQMSLRTANGEWLDELGGYYGVPRLPSESDAAYGPRIVSEVLRPRGNNVAIEMAIKDFTGQTTTVTDVTTYGAATPVHNGAITHNASATYNASPEIRYGLFDVRYGYDLINGGDVSVFAATVQGLINRLRDAGTQIRTLTLTGGVIGDSLTARPTDGDDTQAMAAVATLSDSFTAPDESTTIGAAIDPFYDSLTEPGESASMSVTYSIFYDGARSHNAAVAHIGGTVLEPL